MKILFKYPTRGRPVLFFKTLDLFWRLNSGRTESHFLVAMDVDDPTMNNDLIKDYLKQITPPPCCSFSLEWYYADHKNKVSAINSHIEDQTFDIVVVISDDIEPVCSGYDDILATRMKDYYPHLDGVLSFWDGHTHRRNKVTIPIMGNVFYRGIGYILHPEFLSWGDNHLGRSLQKSGQLKCFKEVLFKHCWGKYFHMDATTQRAAHHRTVDARTAVRLLKGK